MKKISSKLITTIIVVLIIVNTINITIQSSIEKEKFIKIHEELIERIITRLQLNLPIPVWNLQSNVIEDIINTEGLDKSIDEIIVLDEDNKALSTYTNKTIHFAQVFEKTTPIFYADETIATAVIRYNRSAIDEMVSDNINAMIIEALIIIFILSIIIYFTINSLVSKKLLALTSNIKNIKTDTSLEENIIIKSNDEIGYLAREFDSMQETLANNWAQLERINETLEKRVDEEVQKNREKEKQIFEQAKLAQMGEMIGNIAHQWRQPLSYISTTASSLYIEKEMGILNDKELLDKTQGIVAKTQYLSETIDTFRNFIKTDRNLQILSAKDMIKETSNIIKSTLESANIKLEIFTTTDGLYKGYKGEISQVLLNILNNAKDAMFSNKIHDGKIKIKLVEENYNIVLTIEDNAGGIPKEVLPKIFDPYFTTKHQSQGTGIGLYMSKDIVEKHHDGKLEAKNTNEGVLFTITLPKENKVS